MNKAELRKEMTRLLKRQTEQEGGRKSGLITGELVRLKEYSEAKTILAYVSMQEEVSTAGFITKANGDGKCVVVPAVDPGKESMTLHKIKSLEELAPGYLGIREPKDRTCAIPCEKLDLAVVPGLAFDRRGNRLGRGKGMFDRLFEGAKCPKVALAFDFQLVDSVPVEKHDFPVDVIITEKRILRMPGE